MEPVGPQTLEGRLAQQAHWRQAPAVRSGEQPTTDPDGHELEELGEGLRLYRTREQQREIIEGRNMLVTRRLTKRLVEGRWSVIY
ncbi:MAG: hypothetical protein ACJ77N_06635, partial [Chloroflexota bacterium]